MRQTATEPEQGGHICRLLHLFSWFKGMRRLPNCVTQTMTPQLYYLPVAPILRIMAVLEEIQLRAWLKHGYRGSGQRRGICSTNGLFWYESGAPGAPGASRYIVEQTADAHAASNWM